MLRSATGQRAGWPIRDAQPGGPGARWKEQTNLLVLLDRYVGTDPLRTIRSPCCVISDYLRVLTIWEEAFQRLGAVLTATDKAIEPWNQAWAYCTVGSCICYVLTMHWPNLTFDLADKLFSELGDLVMRGKVEYRRASISMIQDMSLTHVAS